MTTRHRRSAAEPADVADLASNHPARADHGDRADRGEHPHDLDDADDLDLDLEEDLDDVGGEPVWLGRVIEVSWAVAARDCALEAGDTDAAARFAGQAREAIARATAAGANLPELAAELDYPGGHTALDGPHIDDQITALRHASASDGTALSEPRPALGAVDVDRTAGGSAAAGLIAAAASPRTPMPTTPRVTTSSYVGTTTTTPPTPPTPTAPDSPPMSPPMVRTAPTPASTTVAGGPDEHPNLPAAAASA
jgi:hypothetical protein